MPFPARHLFVLALAVIAATGLTLYWQWPEPVKQAPAIGVSAKPAQPPGGIPTPLLVAPQPEPGKTNAAQLPTLQGTEVDGELRADSAGNLHLNLAVRDYMDYFLSAADHSGLDAAVQAMLSDASGRLQEPALGQFMNLLGDYMDYKRASMAMLERPLSARQQTNPAGQLQALQQAFNEMAQLRRQHFSNVAVEALFGTEEAYSRYTLDNLALMAREDLTDEAKALAQQRLREQLPEAMRLSEERQAQAIEQQTQTERLWQEGASEEQVRQFLALTYDAPTVERLLDERRSEQAWQQRYAQYQQELAGLQANGLSQADRAREQQRLRQRLFSNEDLHRVETYDAIAAKQQDDQSPDL